MNQSDIAALMKGIAPAIRDLVARAVKPMADRIADLEAKVAAADEARTASVQLIAELERRLDGKSVTVEDVAPLIEDQVAKAVAALPPAEPGKEGPPGKLPVAKAWSDGVTYEAEVRTHNGALWQAVRDTGKEPGENDDWICLAAAGEKGKDADEIEVRGTYDPEAEYKRLNIVALNGGAFIARKDNPGLCPGEDWKQIAMRGKPGEKGLRGEKGERGVKGDPGPGVLHLDVSDQGMFTLVNGDASTVSVDLYPLLSKLGA